MLSSFARIASPASFMLAIGFATGVQAAIVTISTADNEYRPGLLNQQYASYSAEAVVYGDNTHVGSGAGDGNDVSAWDFSLPHDLNTVTGATLLIPLGTYLGSGAPDLVDILSVYPWGGESVSPVSDVLGSGFLVSPESQFWPGMLPFTYASGTVTPGGDPTTMIAFTLDQQAIDDINVHVQGSFTQAADYWFPVAADSPTGTSTVFVGNQPAQLVLTVVPEPGTLVLAAMAGLALSFIRSRRSSARA